MLWKDEIFIELQKQNLFQDSAHRTRFKELLDCYYKASFFTVGLCKCMYLSCWDDEHFIIMLDMLNQLSLKENMNLDDMHETGQLLAEEADGHYSNYVMQLSCAFLMDQPFDTNILPADLAPEGRYIIETALKASAAIDSIPYYTGGVKISRF
ncbi:MAG: hypothetical protein ACOX8M_01655 [Marvinbryantia sp.]